MSQKLALEILVMEILSQGGSLFHGARKFGDKWLLDTKVSSTWPFKNKMIL